MSSPIGNSIAAWLHTGIGTVKGESQDHCFAAAYLMWPGHKTYTAQQFKEYMLIIGYEPVEQRSYGADGKPYWALNLPEHFGRTGR